MDFDPESESSTNPWNSDDDFTLSNEENTECEWRVRTTEEEANPEKKYWSKSKKKNNIHFNHLNSVIEIHFDAQIILFQVQKQRATMSLKMFKLIHGCIRFDVRDERMATTASTSVRDKLAQI
ncbi:unnamed protein product [Ceratitis capitata]|uniref:(Mediterranean fruit fly) hypothetical protein n=1 Tax=Ceratitis capitata TaxID=7213 RepID=A0A811V288_CERCA|nr:unnamed protein product [Ceratitis capitata]